MPKKRKGRSVKAARRGLPAAPKQKSDTPQSMILHNGKVGRDVRRLEKDMRRVMLPYTAKDLKVKQQNVFKDFLAHAGPLGVSHIIAFTRSELSVNMRIIRMPQGPTVHFKVLQSTIARNVLSKLKRPVHFQALFTNSPTVVFNGFDDPQQKHLLLVKTIIQNIFPSINVDTVDLKKVRRTVLINYNAETKTIDFRHYSINATPSDVSRPMKKLVKNKIPDLSKYKDISEFLTNPGQLSESEFEGEQGEVKLEQDLKNRGCRKGTITKIRLVELGPRLTLELKKLEEEVDGGNVLFHAHRASAKTPTKAKKKRTSA